MGKGIVVECLSFDDSWIMPRIIRYPWNQEHESFRLSLRLVKKKKSIPDLTIVKVSRIKERERIDRVEVFEFHLFPDTSIRLVK